MKDIRCIIRFVGGGGVIVVSSSLGTERGKCFWVGPSTKLLAWGGIWESRGLCGLGCPSRRGV
jgi:hypothetical protein